MQEDVCVFEDPLYINSFKDPVLKRNLSANAEKDWPTWLERLKSCVWYKSLPRLLLLDRLWKETMCNWSQEFYIAWFEGCMMFFEQATHGMQVLWLWKYHYLKKSIMACIGIMQGVFCPILPHQTTIIIGDFWKTESDTLWRTPFHAHTTGWITMNMILPESPWTKVCRICLFGSYKLPPATHKELEVEGFAVHFLLALHNC